MANAQSQATTILGWQINQAQQQAAVAAPRQVAASYATLNAAVASFSPAVLALNPQLAQAALQQQTLASTTQQATTALTAQKNVIHDIGVQMKDIPEPSLSSIVPGLGEKGGGVAGGVAGGLRGVRQAAIALPGVGFQSPLVVGLRGVEALADKTGASLLELGASGAIAGTALVAFAVVFKDFMKDLDNAKKLLEGALGAQNTYYEALAKSTSEQVREQLAALTAVRDAQKLQIAELQNAIASAFAQEQAQFGDAGARALNASGKSASAILTTQLDELNKSFVANDFSVTRLTQGLESNAFAANDAAAALKQYADDQVKAAQRDIDINNLTKAQRDEKAAQDMADYNLIQQKLDQGNLTYEAAVALRAQQQDLLTDYDKLTTATNTYGDALEREKAAKEFAKTATDNYFDALAKEGEIRDAITKSAQDLADADQEASDKSIALEADYQQSLTDINADGADRRAQIAQDNAEAVYKIERDFGRSRTSAIRDRDVLSLIKAQEVEHDKLEDQQKAEDKQLDAAQKAEDKQLRSLERSYWKQQNTIDDAYNKQLRTIQRAQAQEQVDLTNTINAEHALTVQGANVILDITNQTYVQMAIAAFNGGRNMVQSLVNGFLAGFTPLPPVTGTAANNAYTRAVQGIVDTRIRQIWEN